MRAGPLSSSVELPTKYTVGRFYAWLPPGYYVDGTVPKLQVLRRPDGSVVVAFFPEAAMAEEIWHAADIDFRRRQEPIEGT
ncbi:hypothetical protein BH23ACT11_BH23ACT11_29270 [soil metagenome]